MNDKTQAPERRWLYCPECPAGQIFTGDEIKAARKDGWENTPPSAEVMQAAEIEAAQEAEETEIARLSTLLVERDARIEELEALDVDKLRQELDDTKNFLEVTKDKLKAARAELTKVKKASGK